jgi:hypothetical protein
MAVITTLVSITFPEREWQLQCSSLCYSLGGGMEYHPRIHASEGKIGAQWSYKGVYVAGSTAGLLDAASAASTFSHFCTAPETWSIQTVLTFTIGEMDAWACVVYAAQPPLHWLPPTSWQTYHPYARPSPADTSIVLRAPPSFPGMNFTVVPTNNSTTYPTQYRVHPMQATLASEGHLSASLRDVRCFQKYVIILLTSTDAGQETRSRRDESSSWNTGIMHEWVYDVFIRSVWLGRALQPVAFGDAQLTVENKARSTLNVNQMNMSMCKNHIFDYNRMIVQ